MRRGGGGEAQSSRWDSGDRGKRDDPVLKDRAIVSCPVGTWTKRARAPRGSEAVRFLPAACAGGSDVSGVCSERGNKV